MERSPMRDIPSPHDYFDEECVREWVETAMRRRPHREDVLRAFVAEVRALGRGDLRILELGSGAGVLAEQLLLRCPVATYYLLDISPHMHAIARERLAPFEERVVFVEGDFSDANVLRTLPGRADVVVTLQAVHELRRAERIPILYQHVSDLLRSQGLFLVCDRVNNGGAHDAHLMSVGEHVVALHEAGFARTGAVLSAGDLTLLRATK